MPISKFDSTPRIMANEPIAETVPIISVPAKFDDVIQKIKVKNDDPKFAR